MSDNPTPPPMPDAPQPSPAPDKPIPPAARPGLPASPTCMIHGTGLGASIEALLKAPAALMFEFAQGKQAGSLGRSLLVILVLGLALFGVVAVDFTYGIQWWAAPLKIIAGLMISALLCLPSLYIFSCLGGLEVSVKTVAGLLLSALALTSLILVGFIPVIWVFSQSSDSLCFMGAILILIWLIALLFGLKLLSTQARALGMLHSLDLRLWMFIFVLVTFQMSCALRPLLGHSNSFLPSDKKFFLQHWAEQLEKNPKMGKPRS